MDWRPLNFSTPLIYRKTTRGWLKMPSTKSISSQFRPSWSKECNKVWKSLESKISNLFINSVFKTSIQHFKLTEAEHEEEGEQAGPSRQRPPPRVTSTPRQTVRRLRLRNVRVIKGKLLKQRAMRKFGARRKSPHIPDIQNSVSRKKRLVSRFTLQKYLCNLIEAESMKRVRWLIKFFPY